MNRQPPPHPHMAISNLGPPPVSAEQEARRLADLRRGLDNGEIGWHSNGDTLEWLLGLYDQSQAELQAAQEREKGLRASLNARMRLLVKCEEREKGLREDMAQIALFAQEVQRGTTGGDAHECGKHIERIALAAQRTEEAGG